MRKYLVFMMVLACGLAAGTGTATAAGENKLDMRLLPKSAVKTSDGCSFALWQKDRDPKTDKFAHAFYVGFHDGQPLPALIKIGKALVEVEKIDPGFDTSSVTDKVQLFRSADKKTTVVLELLEVKTEGDRTLVDAARLTFIQREKLPFVMTAKGGFACEKQTGSADDDRPVPERPAATPSAQLPPNLDPNGLKLGAGKSFAALSGVPGHIAKLVADTGEACDVANTPGAGTSYSISDAMTLWKLPCALYASNSSSVFAVALNGTPHATLLEIPTQPGQAAGAPSYDVLNAEIHAQHGLLISSNINGAGNCGSLDTYQLVEADGESVEFKLLERREKSECSGPSLQPEHFPLTYRAQ